VQKLLNGNNICIELGKTVDKKYKFSISEVSEKTDISTSAINYYVRNKLISPPVKTSKTRAFFSQKTINELIEVKKLKSEGLPIKMIRHMLEKNLTESFSPRTFSGTFKAISDKLSINQNWLKQLLKKDLIAPSKIDKDEYFFDSLDVHLIMKLDSLNKLGIPEEYLIRHSEYNELSEAEALFLIEHINFSNLEKEVIKAIRSNYESVRNILRMKELNKLLN
jgi:DNA-binding transcriptional MerR regulator